MQYQVITHYDHETRGLWTSTSLPMTAEQLTGYISAKHRNYTQHKANSASVVGEFLRYEILPVTEVKKGRREVVAQALAEYFQPLATSGDDYLETDLGQAEYVLEALDRWEDEHGPTDEELTHQRNELRNVLGWRICNVGLYPEAAQPHLLGANMDKIVDAVVDHAWAKGVRLEL